MAYKTLTRGSQCGQRCLINRNPLGTGARGRQPARGLGLCHRPQHPSSPAAGFAEARSAGGAQERWLREAKEAQCRRGTGSWWRAGLGRQPGQKGRSRPGPMTGHTWGLGPGGSEAPVSSPRGQLPKEDGARKGEGWELEGQLWDPPPPVPQGGLSQSMLSRTQHRLEISPGPADTGALAGGCAGP